MTIHKVKAGETLSSIAKKYGTTVDAIASANDLKNKNLIYVGQSFVIPEKVPENKTLHKAFNDCLDAIEKLPEFVKLEAMIHG